MIAVPMPFFTCESHITLKIGRAKPAQAACIAISVHLADMPLVSTQMILQVTVDVLLVSTVAATC